MASPGKSASKLAQSKAGGENQVKSHTSWHHAPLHVFVPGAVYMVTAGTLQKAHFYAGHERLRILEQTLLGISSRGWELRAWALFSNHYHVIVRAPNDDGVVGKLVQGLHSQASRELNSLDRTRGRRVWYQYWDKCLTFEKSYYARLNYVIQNAVHHGLARVAAKYPFCSAAHFEAEYDSAFRKKVQSFKYDRLQEPDDFEVMPV